MWGCALTSRDLVLSVEDGDALKFDSISERCIYLYMRFHADKKGVFRLAMTELASILNVNRQTVLKHVETLIAKRLVRKIGHGRYAVYAEPWSLGGIAKRYMADLKEGAVFNLDVLSERAYGELIDHSSTDPRSDEMYNLLSKIERTGLLSFNEDTGEYFRTSKPV